MPMCPPNTPTATSSQRYILSTPLVSTSNPHIYTLNTPVLLLTPSNTHALSTGTYCSVTTLITS